MAHLVMADRVMALQGVAVVPQRLAERPVAAAVVVHATLHNACGLVLVEPGYDLCGVVWGGVAWRGVAWRGVAWRRAIYVWLWPM